MRTTVLCLTSSDANSRHPGRLFAAPARRSRAACTTARPTSSVARDAAPPPQRLTYNNENNGRLTSLAVREVGDLFRLRSKSSVCHGATSILYHLILIFGSS